MTVKELKAFLETLDENKEICVALNEGCFIGFDDRHIQQVSRLNGYNGYLINGGMWWFKGIC